jgi:hypothetical protein
MLESKKKSRSFSVADVYESTVLALKPMADILLAALQANLLKDDHDERESRSKTGDYRDDSARIRSFYRKNAPLHALVAKYASFRGGMNSADFVLHPPGGKAVPDAQQQRVQEKVIDLLLLQASVSFLFAVVAAMRMFQDFGGAFSLFL